MLRPDPKWIEDLMTSLKLPGLSLAFIDSNGSVFALAAGLANAKTKLPVCETMLFEAASLSKILFAYLVLLLCEKELFDLDQPLVAYWDQAYVPDPRLKTLTARHVLTHTTGFPNWRPEEGQLRFGFDPGRQFSYSGEGFVYLQKVIEHHLGESLDRLMAERVLLPLGMKLSTYVWRPDCENRIAYGHDRYGNPARLIQRTDPNAAYSLLTTPVEFARFMRVLLRPDETPPDLLSSEGVQEMLSPAVPVTDLMPWSRSWPDRSVTLSDDVFWGLGIGLQRDESGWSFWHWGDNGIFHAFCLGDLTDRTGLMVAVNSQHGKKLWKPLLTHLVGHLPSGLAWLISH